MRTYIHRLWRIALFATMRELGWFGTTIWGIESWLYVRAMLRAGWIPVMENTGKQIGWTKVSLTYHPH